jgi:F-type H+-transporting ATPase subunit b
VLQILPDLTLAIQIVLFLFFIWIMNVLLFRPTLKVLEEREQRIDGARSRAAQLEAGVEGAIERHTARVREARGAGEKGRAQLVQEALVEEERIASEGRAQAAETSARIRETIGREAASARVELEAQARQFASLITEQILGRKIA